MHTLRAVQVRPRQKQYCAAGLPRSRHTQGRPECRGWLCGCNPSEPRVCDSGPAREWARVPRPKAAFGGASGERHRPPRRGPREGAVGARARSNGEAAAGGVRTADIPLAACPCYPVGARLYRGTAADNYALMMMKGTAAGEARGVEVCAALTDSRRTGCCSAHTIDILGKLGMHDSRPSQAQETHTTFVVVAALPAHNQDGQVLFCPSSTNATVPRIVRERL